MERIFKRKIVTAALTFSVALVSTLPALAASATKSFSYGSQEVYVTTKKWSAFSKPATNYTIKNIGKGKIGVYTYSKTSAWGWTGPVYQTTLTAGQTFNKSIKANAGDYKFVFRAAGGGSCKVTITSDGGTLR